MLLMLPPKLYWISLFPDIKPNPVTEICRRLEGNPRNHRDKTNGYSYSDHFVGRH